MHPPAPESRNRMIRSPKWIAAICLVALLGCNTNAGDILLNSGSATGRTLFDLWLTSAANGFANLLNPPPATDGGGGDNDGTGDSDGSGDLTGDATAGAQTFADNCAVCHGADGTGDIGPNITGVSASTITAKFGGSHGGGSFPGLTPQDHADIAAFLQP